MPGKLAAEGGGLGSKLFVSGHEDQPAFCLHKLRGGGHGFWHLFDCAQGYAVKLLAKRLGTMGIDLCTESKRPHRFLEEGRFFALGFSERYLDVRAADSNRDSREAGSRSVVEQSLDFRRKSLRTRNGF